jgi:Fungal Zn(2)-Cys(6) binuclear cluster domain
MNFGPDSLPALVADRPNRSRQWHHKVKTGCLTCKTRRIKCTEERPSCSRCLSAGRQCAYQTQPKSRFDGTTSQQPITEASALLLTKPRDHYTSDPEELRAFQFFLEVTAPAASTYNPHTKAFFVDLIPQVAESESAVRHLVVAVAAKQESMSSSSDNALTLSQVQAKHYLAGLNQLSRGTSRTTEEVLLLASALFIVLGQFESPEDQTAQSLLHLMASMRILIERIASPGQPRPSRIIDTYVQPIFARLEMMMSVFMVPERGLDAIYCSVEPVEPVLPDQFKDLLEARQTWVAICCWRYRKQARSNPWTPGSECFKDLRTKLLKWNNLIMAYAGRAALGSEHELHRAMAMISQFRLLFLAMMFSVRHDLHLHDQVRPSFVNLLQPGEVSVTYHLPQRVLDMVPDLDWETSPFQDEFQVRLWPIVDAVKRSESAGLLRMTFRV